MPAPTKETLLLHPDESSVLLLVGTNNTTFVCQQHCPFVCEISQSHLVTATGALGMKTLPEIA
jgi:hypothetical protein